MVERVQTRHNTWYIYQLLVLARMSLLNRTFLHGFIDLAQFTLIKGRWVRDCFLSNPSIWYHWYKTKAKTIAMKTKFYNVFCSILGPPLNILKSRGYNDKRVCWIINLQLFLTQPHMLIKWHANGSYTKRSQGGGPLPIFQDSPLHDPIYIGYHNFLMNSFLHLQNQNHQHLLSLHVA